MTIQRPTAELFAPDGVTSLGQLTNARAITWQDELSKVGSGSFEIPLDDAMTASITDRCIVKFTLFGSVRSGCRIVSEAIQLAVNGRRWLRFENQPGLLQLLGDGILLSEIYPLVGNSPSDRIFGYMSLAFAGVLDPADWTVPTQTALQSDVRANYPPDLFALNPSWMAFADPDTPQAAGTTNYFRYGFTVAGPDPIQVEFVFTADNFLTLYFDAVQVIAPDMTKPFGWRTTATVTLTVQPGDHIIGATVFNAWSEWSNNALALIGAAWTLDSAGNRSSLLLETVGSSWAVNDGTTFPGWTRGQVLWQVVGELQNRSVFGPSQLTIGFTLTDDTDGNPWTDAPAEYHFPIANINGSDIATQLSESGIDVAVDPDTMTLNCWVRKGVDLSGTVELKLGELTAADGKLKSYETTSTVARFTDVYTQLADGTWLLTFDAAARTAVGGGVEVGLALGSAGSMSTAAQIAAAQLAESAIPQIAVTGEPTALVGAQAYVDYQLGDTILVPAHRNAGTMKARVLSITVDSTGDVLRVWPQFVPDLSV